MDYPHTLDFPAEAEMVITREFNAAPELVFDASTKPELVRKWWGPTQYEMTVCEIDLRVGGKWRYVQEVEGQSYSFSGIYKEIERPHKLVYTEVFQDDETNEALYTTTFNVGADGKTLMTVHVVFPSSAARDGYVQSGMEEGMAETHRRLDALLESQQTK